MSEKKLKNCPFCGTSAKVRASDSRIVCPNDNCAMGSMGSMLRSDWQNQPMQDSILARLTAAEDVVDALLAGGDTLGTELSLASAYRQEFKKGQKEKK